MPRRLALIAAAVAVAIPGAALLAQDPEPFVVEAPEVRLDDGSTLGRRAGEADPPDDRPVFGSGLDLVNVTITVRDTTGRLVPDLAAEDFVVYEDGRPQKAVIFGSPAMLGGEVPLEDENFAVNLGMLLDTSESMLKELRLSQEAAVRFLENIPRARDLITIFFDQDIRISRYNSENQQGLFQRILEAKGGGNTALYDALTVYMARAGDVPGRKILVLLSDGEDTTSSTNLSQLIQLVKASPVTIYPVAFSGSFNMGSNRAVTSRGVLNQLAEISGGRVFAPSASRDLAAVYAAILEELKAQYVLGYVSDNPKTDGRFRRLKVELRGKGLRVRHRQGYVVPRKQP